MLAINNKAGFLLGLSTFNTNVSVGFSRTMQFRVEVCLYNLHDLLLKGKCCVYRLRGFPSVWEWNEGHCASEIRVLLPYINVWIFNLTHYFSRQCWSRSNISISFSNNWKIFYVTVVPVFSMVIYMISRPCFYAVWSTI